MQWLHANVEGGGQGHTAPTTTTTTSCTPPHLGGTWDLCPHSNQPPAPLPAPRCTLGGMRPYKNKQ